MRISELAEASGLRVATIKYYLREGLLPPGTKVTERLSEYGEHHLARLRVLRVLREVGDIPVEGLRTLVEAAEDDSRSVHEMFGAACDAMTPAPRVPPDEDARAAAIDLVTHGGWDRVRHDAPGLARLADLITTARAHGLGLDPAHLSRVLALIDELAELELALVDDSRDRDGMLQQMVVGQAVFGEFLLSLRRLAQEHHSARRFDGPDPAGAR